MKIRKLLAVIVSAGVLLCSLSLTAMANDGSTERYTTQQTALYSDANYSSTVIMTIPAGAKVFAWTDVQRNGFTNCMYGQGSGWVVTSVLSATRTDNNIIPGTTPGTYTTGGGGQSNLSGNWNCQKNLSQRTKVYSSMTVSQPSGWTMEAGTPVFVTTVSNNGWATITSPYNGYIPTCYIQGWNTEANYPLYSNTWYNGYDWSAVYNYDYYRTNNPDVAAAYGSNPSSLIAHFVNNGMAEGRRASASFDVYVYMGNRPDLSAMYGGNLPVYYKDACGIPY